MRHQSVVDQRHQAGVQGEKCHGRAWLAEGGQTVDQGAGPAAYEEGDG